MQSMPKQRTIRQNDKHNTFWRLWQAVEILAIGTGKEGDKLETIRGILTLSENDFEHEEQKKLFREIQTIYRTHPSWRALKPGDTTTVTLGSTPWQFRKKLKRMILDLFYSVIE